MAAVSAVSTNNLIMGSCVFDEETLKTTIQILAMQPACIPTAKKILEALGQYPCSKSMFTFVTEYGAKLNVSIPKERITADFQLCNFGNTISTVFQALTSPAAIATANVEHERKAVAAMTEYESKVAAAEPTPLTASEQRFIKELKPHCEHLSYYEKDPDEIALFLLGRGKIKIDITPHRKYALWDLNTCRTETFVRRMNHPLVTVFHMFPTLTSDIPGTFEFDRETCRIISRCPEVIKQIELSHDSLLDYLGCAYDPKTGLTSIITKKNFASTLRCNKTMIVRSLKCLTMIGCKKRAQATVNAFDQIQDPELELDKLVWKNIIEEFQYHLASKIRLF